jgi:folylpolyglutamate synthase/dihydropteroate synthase
MSDANGKVPIPPEVLKGIEAVRVSGRTNMLDRNAVAAIALDLGHVDAAFWLDDKANRKTYAEGVFRGFREEKTVTP